MGQRKSEITPVNEQFWLRNSFIVQSWELHNSSTWTSGYRGDT